MITKEIYEYLRATTSKNEKQEYPNILGIKYE